ncbi:hypothetical protein EW026_g7235 [Hermanssonia centrifuga]|uniref:Uncharacterized protein n=1 Tax=Hermanssonia centrifuga TaxID=98765 RepID=A0A4S4K8P5_9APHY|nr:hypothetical protein EW026_g7235 [Hermanssonia centrifuga]
MHITRDREKRTISFSQSAYINRILTRYRFDEIRTVTTPMHPNVALPKEQCATSERQQEEMKNKPYREALGALMYASVGTRLDITYAVSTLAKFSQNPGPTHWTALKRVFAYLRDIVCLSTTEAEYIALTHAAKEAIWLHHLLDEVFPKRFKLPITVYSDNQGAIALSKDDRFHTQTKQIDIRFHFVRQYVEDGTLSIMYLPTDKMLADALTKALAGPQLTKLAGAIGLQTYKYQANCAFLIDMPARPTWRYQQSTQSSQNASSPPPYNRRPRRCNIQTPSREDRPPIIQHPTLPNRLPNTTREPARCSTATLSLAYISILPRRIMCGIAFTALIIFVISTLIGMHVYVVTQFIAIMNRLVQEGNARRNEDYSWSTTTNNNNAGGWGDSSARWGTTNNNGWATTNDN